MTDLIPAIAIKKDAIERAVWAAVFAVVSPLSAAGILDVVGVDDKWFYFTPATVAIAATLSRVKSWIATKVGSPDTNSFVA